MARRVEYPSNCQYCGYDCALHVAVEDGKVVGVRPDESRYPYDPSVMYACPRWPMNVEAIDAEDRIDYPLRRVGERGSGLWERVSWDEALDDIAARLTELAGQDGPRTLASAIGGPHASYWPLHRFMNLFGSPNNMGIGQICWNPRIWMDIATFGWTVEADVQVGLTTCFVIWGTNPAQSDNSSFWNYIKAYAEVTDPDPSPESGAKRGALIVIDPIRTEVAAIADLWLPVKPGTDCYLALGMLNVIIGEGLQDAAFVSEWCHGFDELAEHVKAYPPETVAEICGIPADDIRRAARLIAGAGHESAATAVVSGRGIDQIGEAVAPTHRAICALRAVTGNVDRPGSCVLAEAPDFVSESEMEMSDAMPDSCREASLNAGITLLQSYDGYDTMRALTEKLGRTPPMRYLASAHPHLLLKAMETHEPYPVRALIVQATNMLLTYGGTQQVMRSLSNLDLLVVLEYHMTPTAAMADYVLPAAGNLERPVLQIHGGVANTAYGGPAAVAPYYGRKTDYEIFRELGLRLGQEDAWPQETLEEAFAYQLSRAGVSWEDFCRSGVYWPRPTYAKHELPGADGKPRGFATTTGKVELASEILPKLGGTRLPEPVCGGPHGPGGERSAQERGFTMVTGARKQPYNASMYFRNKKFRQKSQVPCVAMSAEAARRENLREGDVVEVATDCGHSPFVLEIAEMRDDVISVDYGWWHPEWFCEKPELGGIFESNVNLLTRTDLCEPMIGTWAYNAIPADVVPSAAQIGWSPDAEAPDVGRRNWREFDGE